MVPLGLDKEKVLLQIARLEESVQKIAQNKGKVKAKNTRAALERWVQIAVEETLNIGNHVISGLGLERPDSYREIFKVLENRKIIAHDLSLELQQFAVFRNRLVHMYWKVEDEEFIAQLRKAAILTDFVKALLAYLQKEKLL